MAYAPFHNLADAPALLGIFNYSSSDARFEYSARTEDDLTPQFSPAVLPHFVYVGSGETRMARVLKTVAYVAIDEDADGNPVLEKWDIRKHRSYVDH